MYFGVIETFVSGDYKTHTKLHWIWEFILKPSIDKYRNQEPDLSLLPLTRICQQENTFWYQTWLLSGEFLTRVWQLCLPQLITSRPCQTTCPQTSKFPLRCTAITSPSWTHTYSCGMALVWWNLLKWLGCLTNEFGTSVTHSVTCQIPKSFGKQAEVLRVLRNGGIQEIVSGTTRLEFR